MNVVLLMGRLTADPEVRYSQNSGNAVAKYTLAVDRDFAREGEERGADFIRCTCFGKTAEFAEKFLNKGKKVAIRGTWQTGSYDDENGNKVYTNDCIVQQHWFCESKNAEQSGGGSSPQSQPAQSSGGANDFMNIPDGLVEDLPFN